MSKYYQQRTSMLGDVAVATSTTSINTSTPASVNINAATSIIRIHSASAMLFLKYDGIASSSNWDYIIPSGGVLDLFNFANASSISLLAVGSTTLVYIGQY